MDSGTATLNRKTYCVSVKVKVATTRGNTTNLYQHLRQHREKYKECMREKDKLSNFKDKETT
ncbi:hypothetical protein P3565_22535, partial [Vibrio parahaemolyticus]|nr:hypothetical protein [Vibrio parahaemolyticus]